MSLAAFSKNGTGRVLAFPHFANMTIQVQLIEQMKPICSIIRSVL